MQPGPPAPGAERSPASGSDVCLVAHLAYGAMAGGSSGHAGGVERQTSLMARWLAGRGHAVSLITWAEGPPGDETIDGVRVVKTCPRTSGLPGLRFFHPRWTGLEAALDRANARTCYHNSAEYVTGQVAWWTARRGRRFVYSVASDMDCDPALPDLGTRRERWLYRFGLRRAHRVIAQTETQVHRLREGFGVAARVIPMPCPGPDPEDFAMPVWRPGGRVLWVGRLCPEKRPDRLVAVAEACPGLHFDVVGPVDGPVETTVKRARDLPNVTVHGVVPRDRIAGFYREAGVLLCTSDREGFPNTFLEAWSYGLPVVSTHDPDGIIRTHGLGAVVTAEPGSISAVLRELLASRDAWTEASARTRRHYLTHHTVDRVMASFEKVLVGSSEGEDR